MGVYESVQRAESHMWVSAHLKALGADFLAFLHPGDPGFWLPGSLAHKWCNSARDTRLVLRGFDESWRAWGGGSKGGKEGGRRRRDISDGGGRRAEGWGGVTVMLVAVPVTSAACKSRLSTSIYRFLQKHTQHRCYCFAQHQLSHRRKTLSLCCRLSSRYADFFSGLDAAPHETKSVANRQFGYNYITGRWCVCVVVGELY